MLGLGFIDIHRSSFLILDHFYDILFEEVSVFFLLGKSKTQCNGHLGLPKNLDNWKNFYLEWNKFSVSLLLIKLQTKIPVTALRKVTNFG